MSRVAAKESSPATRLIFRQIRSPRPSAGATFLRRYAAEEQVVKRSGISQKGHTSAARGGAQANYFGQKPRPDFKSEHNFLCSPTAQTTRLAFDLLRISR